MFFSISSRIKINSASFKIFVQFSKNLLSVTGIHGVFLISKPFGTSDANPQIILKFCEMFLHFHLKGLFIMLVINYACVSAGPLILHAECSPYKLLSMLLKKKFLHALEFTRNFGVFGEGWKMFKVTASKRIEGLTFEVSK